MSTLPDRAANTQANGSAWAIFARYLLGDAYNEMFDQRLTSRRPYAQLYERLLEMSADQLIERQQAADLSFLHQGITFTGYGHDDGTEKIFPYDLLPRIITAAEWATIERGLTQRIMALNLFLNDAYNEGKILRVGASRASTTRPTWKPICRTWDGWALTLPTTCWPGSGTSAGGRPRLSRGGGRLRQRSRGSSVGGVGAGRVVLLARRVLALRDDRKYTG